MAVKPPHFLIFSPCLLLCKNCDIFFPYFFNFPSPRPLKKFCASYALNFLQNLRIWGGGWYSSNFEVMFFPKYIPLHKYHSWGEEFRAKVKMFIFRFWILFCYSGWLSQVSVCPRKWKNNCPFLHKILNQISWIKQ